MSGWRTTALLACALTCAAAVGAQERVGTLAALEGRADDQHAGTPQPTALAPGDALLLGDRLRTMEASRARLALRDDSVLTMAPSSELVLTAQVVGPSQATTRLGVVAGAVRALVPGRYGTPGSKFEVETPTAISGVRGTGFIVFYDPTALRTRVVGLFDRTWVCGRRDPECRRQVVVGPGQETEVADGGFPTKPRTLSSSERKALAASTESVSGGLEPEAELGPGKTGPEPTQAGDGYIDDPATPHPPGKRVQSTDSAVVDQPIDRIDRRSGPGIPPIPPTK